MVGGATGSARAGANAGVGGNSAEVSGNTGVGGLNICLVNICVGVGCVVMGVLVVPGLLGCTCKGNSPAAEV